MKAWTKIPYILLSICISVSLLSLLTRVLYESTNPLLYNGAMVRALLYNETINGFRWVNPPIFKACDGSWDCLKAICEVYMNNPNIWWMGVQIHSDKNDTYMNLCGSNNWIIDHSNDFKPELSILMISIISLLIYYILSLIFIISKSSYSWLKVVLLFLFRISIYIAIGIIYELDVRNMIDTIPSQFTIPEDITIIMTTFAYTLDFIIASQLLFSEESTSEIDDLLDVN